MKNIKGSLPNILTLINLSLGVLAILLAVTEPTNKGDLLIYASLLVMVAALTDRFDGKIARMLDVTSELGKELDSLSDLISFGVAPIIIAWKISFVDLGILGYVIALIFPMAGAFRLARYNVSSFDNVFSGMPITVAGAFVSIDNLVNSFEILKKHQLTPIHKSVSVALVIMLSYLMISKIKIKKR